MKKIIILLILSFALISCWEVEVKEEIVKKDFVLETKSIDDFSNSLSMEKTWKISSSQDIDLSSQASWRISKIYVKEWDKVTKWKTIWIIEDTISDYWLALERAENSLEKARLNYESTESQLDKNIADIKINLANLKIDESNSKSSLEVDKIDNSIKKLALDFDNLKIWNEQSVENFKNSFSKDITSFTVFIDNVIDFSDKILWVTSKNNDINDSFEDYLWSKDSNQKRDTEELLRKLINYRNNELININFNFDWDSLFDKNINSISEWYKIIYDLLKSLDTTFDNSIASVWSLSESQINWYRSSINWYLSTYSASNWWFITLKNSVNSFLDTFKNTEESLLKQIELLESDKKIYIKWLDVNLELNEWTLEQAISNKELTLKQLDTATVDAQISYKQALTNYEKLYIKSPINGIIWEIFIDEWQEVWMWTKLFNISNNSSNEVLTSFSKDELSFIENWSKAFVDFNWKTYTGSIYSISSIADSNLKYISRISFDDDKSFIGDIVNISIPFKSKNKLLPLNIVKITSSWDWIINTFADWKIVEKTVKIWRIFSDKIELLEKLDSEVKIITTNIDNFDENKFNLILKNTDEQ